MIIRKIENMKAIEYNMMMTILQLLKQRLPAVASEYGLKYKSIPVLPEYPRDMTRLNKPSIIVRKVSNSQSKIGMGNFAGSYFDENVMAHTDVIGKVHEYVIQFDVATSSNSDRLLLESVIADGILNSIAYDGGKFSFYDFTRDMNNPSETGLVSLVGDPYITNLDTNEDSIIDYVGVIRHGFRVVQTILPKMEYVDLTKWIKQSYTIKL